MFIFTLFPSICFSDDLKTAKGFFYSNQYKRAADYYIRSLKTEKKGNADITYRVGLCYFLLGDFQEANSYFIKAKKQNPNIFQGKIFRVPQASMSPTLLPGDQIIVDNEYYENEAIMRGDVVVYIYPEDKKRTFIHRIMALPGDRIESKDKVIFVNGRKIHDQYAQNTDASILKDNKEPRDNFGPYVIPKGEYFVMGDNRDRSYDSRYWGYIARELIIGKALVIYASLPERESLEGSKSERIGLIIK